VFKRVPHGLRRVNTYHLYFIPAKTALPLPG